MNLNLGLESLNRVNSAVVPFTPASAIEMQNASEAITNLMASLENYYDAARNAMLVKKAVKKYGKTQSIVALIGQEGLAAAQSFSMEGFWEKTKAFLIKIWEKIKEWWGRFWGMFFSVENKLSSFVSELNSSSKKLDHLVEFDAPSQKELATKDTEVRNAVDTLKKATANPTDDNLESAIRTFIVNGQDSTVHGAEITAGSFPMMHYRLESISAIKTIAESMLKIIKEYKQLKKDIDDYVKKALDRVGTMKMATQNIGSRSDDFHTAGSALINERATSENQDVATKVLKDAAKINNRLVAAVVKAATQIAIKLMAHTRLVG